MSACPQCSSPIGPNDKFCNSCGFALQPPGGGPGSPFGAPPGGGQPSGQGAPPPQAPAQQGGGGPPFGSSPYGPPPGQGAPPPHGGGYGGPPQGAPPPQRCQQGHDIQPGQSYCAFGHPIAMDNMQFASDMYGAPQGGYPGQPGQPGGAQPFGAPPQQPQYGGYQGQPQQPQGYGGYPQGQPPPQQGYGGPGYGQAPFGAPPQPQPFGAPPQPQPQQPNYGSGGYPQGPAPTGETSPAAMPAPPNKMLRGFLLSYQTNKQGDFWPLHGGRLTVGRANAGEPVDIPLADATISSRHAALLVDNVSGSVSVEDTGSTNGTYVNDEHLGFNGRRELRDGDRLRFGGFTTIVKIIGQV